MSRFDTFLFDLDGTLIDHFEAIHRSHSDTMRHFGLPAPSMAQVRGAVGGGLEEAVGKLFGPAHRALVDQAVPFYRQRWQSHLLVGVKLLPGARELLGALQASGATCAVFTNKHGPSARTVCEHLGISPLLAGIFGALDTPWLKPQREFSDHVFRTLGRPAATALMVGDSPYDIQAAKNGGFPCWCVTTGTHNEAELQVAGAVKIFPDLPALGRALLTH